MNRVMLWPRFRRMLENNNGCGSDHIYSKDIYSKDILTGHMHNNDIIEFLTLCFDLHGHFMLFILLITLSHIPPVIFLMRRRQSGGVAGSLPTCSQLPVRLDCLDCLDSLKTTADHLLNAQRTLEQCVNLWPHPVYRHERRPQ